MAIYVLSTLLVVMLVANVCVTIKGHMLDTEVKKLLETEMNNLERIEHNEAAIKRIETKISMLFR